MEGCLPREKDLVTPHLWSSLLEDVLLASYAPPEVIREDSDIY